jgi:hypothetical protein
METINAATLGTRASHFLARHSFQSSVPTGVISQVLISLYCFRICLHHQSLLYSITQSDWTLSACFDKG